MNEFIDTKFYEKYIKKIPIEEQIRGQVRAECHYMDKADIYEWITQDEIKIYNLQSKIDKANEILDKLCVMKPWNDTQDEMRKIYRPIKNTSKQEVYKAICDLRDILKEDK